MQQVVSAEPDEAFNLLVKCLESQVAEVFVEACRALVVEPAGWLLGLGNGRLVALRTILQERMETLDEEDKPQVIVALDRLAKARSNTSMLIQCGA